MCMWIRLKRKEKREEETTRMRRNSQPQQLNKLFIMQKCVMKVKRINKIEQTRFVAEDASVVC